ncbi:MAG: CHAT domain-containing protein [Akkermansiaceae bacterium]
MGDEVGARKLLEDGMTRAEELMVRATSNAGEGAKLNFRARIDPFSILVELKEWEWLGELLVKHKGRLLDGGREREISWRKILNGLDEQEVLVDALRYRNELGEWSYGALVYSQELTGPHWVQLGSEKRLERLILLQKALSDLAREKAGMAAEPLLRDLYDDFWQPLSLLLPKQTRRVTLSPDGGLGLIPWAVLRSKEGRFLCEEMESLGLVSNARKVLEESGNLREVERVSFGLSDFSSHRKKEQDEWWGEVADLPGVNLELEKGGGQIFRDRDATEAKLAGLSKVPGVLHLATHGVFEGRAGLGGEGLDLEQEWQRGAILLEPGQGEDGVLRIFEIEKLNLAGCELVTVSSCQSGLGGMVSGVGVIGVSRAFLKAGAKRVLITLWEIRDSSTPDFMESFYDHAMKRPPEEALWTAQRERLSEAKNIDEAVLRYGGFSMTR